MGLQVYIRRPGTGEKIVVLLYFLFYPRILIRGLNLRSKLFPWTYIHYIKPLRIANYGEKCI